MAVYFVTDFHLGIPSLEDSQERERKLLCFHGRLRQFNYNILDSALFLQQI